MSAPTRPPRASLVLIGCIYLAFCLLSLWLAGKPGNVATLWFANPVGSVALALAPWRRWAALLACLLASNGFANWLMAGASFDASPILESLIFAPGNLLEMGLAGLLMRSLPLSRALDGTRELSALLLRGCLLPILPGALLGAMLVAATMKLPTLDALGAWICSALIGSVALTPFAVWIGRATRKEFRRLLSPHALYATSVVMAVVLLATTSFRQPFVIVALGQLIVALASPLPIVAWCGLVSAIEIGILIGFGVVLPPASGLWWDDAMFYTSYLASLLPGLYLSVSESHLRHTISHLQQSEERFRRLYYDTPAIMQSVDAEGRLMMVSRLWLKTFGYEEGEVRGRPFVQLLTPASAHYARDVVIPESLEKGGCRDITFQMVCRDGRVLDVLMSAVWERDERGAPVRCMEVLQDVTEKNALALRSRLAETDALTGLPNRRVMHDRLEIACSQVRHHGGSFAVGFMDLDHFKQVNDSWGHEVGDALLREVAHQLQASVRVSDSVCRIGGDEFVLLLTEPGPADHLPAIGHKIQQAIAAIRLRVKDATGSELELRTGCSLGLALCPVDGEDAASLLAAADRAMYAAKRSGRGQLTLAQDARDQP